MGNCQVVSASFTKHPQLLKLCRKSTRTAFKVESILTGLRERSWGVHYRTASLRASPVEGECQGSNQEEVSLGRGEVARRGVGVN